MIINFKKKFLNNLLEKSVRFLRKLTQAKSQTEDQKRREFILNTLLLGSIALSAIATIIYLVNSIINSSVSKNSSLFLPLFVLIIFLSLYTISRLNFSTIAAYLFLAIYLIPNIYMTYKWGVELTIGLLFYVLIIVMSGILINTRFATIITAIISLVVIIFSYLQDNGIIHPDLQWKKEMVGVSETVVFSIIFTIIAITSWLSNREIEKSLTRARKSEAELKKERDLLEIKVADRTKELKQAQLEKVSQLYRFAEFGKLSSGLFHDLANPLTSLLLNIEQVKNSSGAEKTKQDLDLALKTTKRIGQLVQAMQKQIKQQETVKIFSLSEEINYAVQVFQHKALISNVKINFPSPAEDILTYGDPLKFNQLITNLVSNAIDAYDNFDSTENPREVLIKLFLFDNNIQISIQDWGSGIAQENIDKIFEPLFTTKDADHGTGIGLSSSKDIIEKNFHGNIKVISKINQGSTFIITFPQNNNN